MKTTTEMKIEISNARISNAVIMPDGTCKLELEVEMAPQKQNNNEIVDDECILIEVSKLSLEDEFMQYMPKNHNEERLKALISRAIQEGVEDFYKPIIDPSLDRIKNVVYYKAGESPAIGKRYEWWEKTLENSKWCFGTRLQYASFLGVLIKNLITKGWSVEESWDAVCTDSKKLGHYWNSENAKHYFEDTGSREICGFYDLANTQKILAKEFGGYCTVSGCYNDFSNKESLANFSLSITVSAAVPWLVLKKYY